MPGPTTILPPPRPPHAHTPQFHVDNLSSAHIYYRLPSGTPWTAIPAPLLTDIAQLTKANSIDGNKKDNITIIYTPWANLRKDGSMAVGQVAFHDPRKVKKLHVPARDNAIVNRLNKTKREEYPDLQKLQEDARREQRMQQQEEKRRHDKEAKRVEKERKEARWQRDHAYDDLLSEEAVTASSNQERPEGWLDDFM